MMKMVGSTVRDTKESEGGRGEREATKEIKKRKSKWFTVYNEPQKLRSR